MGFILGENRWPRRAGILEALEFLFEVEVRRLHGRSRNQPVSCRPSRPTRDDQAPLCMSRSKEHLWLFFAFPQKTARSTPSPRFARRLPRWASTTSAGICRAWPPMRRPMRCWRRIADEIDEMKQRGGYRTADVIDVNPETPGLEAMLARFDKEHTHYEDEVRFILAGRGIFFLHFDGRVVSVEVGPGDMLRVPRGTTHWFTLCEDRRIRAIRWFQDTTGWTPLLHRHQASIRATSRCASGRRISGRASARQSPHDNNASPASICSTWKGRLRRCRW